MRETFILNIRYFGILSKYFIPKNIIPSTNVQTISMNSLTIYTLSSYENKEVWCTSKGLGKRSHMQETFTYSEPEIC